MIIVIESLNKEELKKHWSKINTTLNNCETLCGNSKWTYLEWIKQLQAFPKDKNIIVLDSWITHRAQARINDKTPIINDDECAILNKFVEHNQGHIDFILNKTEETTLKIISEDYGCLDEHAKKIMNAYTYDILQAKIMCFVNRCVVGE